MLRPPAATAETPDNSSRTFERSLKRLVFCIQKDDHPCNSSAVFCFNMAKSKKRPLRFSLTSSEFRFKIRYTSSCSDLEKTLIISRSFFRFSYSESLQRAGMESIVRTTIERSHKDFFFFTQRQALPLPALPLPALPHLSALLRLLRLLRVVE